MHKFAKNARKFGQFKKKAVLLHRVSLLASHTRLYDSF